MRLNLAPIIPNLESEANPSPLLPSIVPLSHRSNTFMQMCDNSPKLFELISPLLRRDYLNRYENLHLSNYSKTESALPKLPCFGTFKHNYTNQSDDSDNE